MKILALDSSGLVASAAIVEEGNLIGEYTIHNKKTHSQTLLPMLDELIKMSEVDAQSVDAIAIAAGPGSFTGLRIGSATVKGLAYAWNKPVIEVPTVDALAYNVCYTDRLVCPIMDARRSQVYTGIYKWENGAMKVVMPQDAMAITELLERLEQYEEKVLFLGDGVPVFAEIIKETMGDRADFAPAHMLRQRAGAVAALALEYAKEGKMVTATEHKPEYLRMSQAERERMEQNQG